jgi:hypothetical protein
MGAIEKSNFGCMGAIWMDSPADDGRLLKLQIFFWCNNLSGMRELWRGI